MTITVVISTWQVPYDQVVEDIVHFGGDDAGERALEYINEQSARWWAAHDGDRWLDEALSECEAEGQIPEVEPYAPIAELGYNMARYELWGGEAGFHAMLDKESFAALNEAHYKREYDDKGLVRPGYLINSYVAGHKPDGMTEAEREKYAQQQAEGMAAIESTYGSHTKQ